MLWLIKYESADCYCRCSTTVFEVQRFWVRDSSLRSGMDPLVVDKPHRKYAHKTTVISALGRDKNRVSQPPEPPTDTWVLMPQLRKKDACRRCGKIFAIRENSADSCRFHADSEGIPGKYFLKEVRNDDDGNHDSVIVSHANKSRNHVFDSLLELLWR